MTCPELRKHVDHMISKWSMSNLDRWNHKQFSAKKIYQIQNSFKSNLIDTDGNFSLDVVRSYITDHVPNLIMEHTDRDKKILELFDIYNNIVLMTIKKGYYHLIAFQEYNKKW